MATLLGLVLFVPVLAVTVGGVAAAAAIVDAGGRDAYLGAGLLAGSGVCVAVFAGMAVSVLFPAGLAATAIVAMLHARVTADGASVPFLLAIYLSPLVAVLLQVFAIVVGVAALGAGLVTRYARRRAVEAA